MGGSAEIKLRAEKLSLHLPDRHKSPIRAPHIEGLLARLERDNSSRKPHSANVIRADTDKLLSATVTKAGAVTRWLIEEQPDGCRSSYRD